MVKRTFAARAALLTGSAFCVLATPAFAQEAASEGLDEIVVTANKREESLQKAPLAISAVSGAQLELRGLAEAKDLSAIAPNVSALGGTTNSTAAVVVIRGIPSPADETQGYDSAIGMYIDGVYIARSSAHSSDIAEIERVEVLRGPQGTLFGRNTTGGAINFITKRPSSDQGVKLRLGGGNLGQLTGRVVMNSGDMNGVRASIAYMHKQRNGTVDNLLESKDSRDPGAFKTDGLRLAFEADASDNLNIYNVFDLTRIKGMPTAAQLIGVGNGTVRPDVVFDGGTFTPVQAGNLGAFLAGATMTQPGCDKVATRAYRSSMCLDTAGMATDTIWGNMLRMELQLDGVKVRSTTAYRRWTNKLEGSDLDGLGGIDGHEFTTATLFNAMPAALISPVVGAANAPFVSASPVPRTSMSLFKANNDRKQNQFSQELEIVSDNESNLQWVLGAFFFKESGSEINAQNFVIDTNTLVFTTASFGALAPLLQAVNPARYRMTGSTLGYDSKGRSFALYGQGTLRPGGPDGALGITLGLRYSWDKKEVDRFQNGGTPFGAAEHAINQREASFNAPTGHLTIDYRASDDINMYARAARGYRSGGFNLRQSTQLDRASTTTVNEEIPLIPFNEETIWSYEIGTKLQFNNRFRLNLAAFHNIYNDQLVTVPIPIVGGGSFGTQVVNAGKTTYTGFEVEAQAKLTDNFSIDGNFGYIDIKIKEFPGADNSGVLRNIAALNAGTGYAPKYTAAVAANLTVPIGGDREMSARVGYNYTAGYEMFANTLTAPFQQITRGDSRGLLDGQLRFTGLAKGVSLTIWGKNLTDEHYITRTVDFGALGFANGIYGDPRTFGATLDFEF